MDTSMVLEVIDREIKRLQEARALLAQEESAGNGLQKGARKGVPSANVKKSGRKVRVLSPEARKRIADAQKKRWAAAKRAAA